MAASDVLRALQTDLEDPCALKSGEALESLVLRTARQFIADNDRAGLVDALRMWLELRQEPQTMLAVTVAKHERLKALESDICALRAGVADGQFFPSYYLRWIDEALNAISTTS